MTQQYILGEFSELISLLEPASGERLAGAVHALRLRVECAPVAALAPLVAEAATVADTVCWAMLDEGDAAAFARHATAAALFHEFAISANLLP